MTDQTDKNNLNENEVLEVRRLLSRLAPGKLPLEIFNEICKLVVIPVIEIVPIRTQKEKVEILLLKKNHDDPIWPNLYYVPGSIINATDLNQNCQEAIDRIIQGKLNGVQVAEVTFAGLKLCNAARGPELAIIYWTKVLNDSPIGQFYDAEDLPKKMVENHEDFVTLALKKYQTTN